MRPRHWLVLGAVALVVAAVLVVRLTGAASAGPVRFSGIGSRYAVTVTLDRAGTGTVRAEVLVQSAAHAPVAVDTVSLSAVMTGMAHATEPLVAHRGQDGRFVAEGELFPMSGPWQLGVDVSGPPGVELITVDVLVRP